jgi:sugar lactone lactonase YvrE
VLVAEFANGRIVRTGPNPDSRVRMIIDGLAGPVDLVIVDATRGYVTESLAGRITEFSLNQYEKRTLVDGLDRPEGLALLPSGALAVAEVGARRVLAIDPKSGRRTVMADNLPIGLESPGGTGDPYAVSDLATAGDGTLYLSADRDRTVLRLSPRPAGRR